MRYTFAFLRDGAEPLFTRSLGFADDDAAIHDGREQLRELSTIGLTGVHSIRVGRGGGDGGDEEVEWLGAWDWGGDAPRWRP